MAFLGNSKVVSKVDSKVDSVVGGNSGFALRRINYLLLAVGLGVIVVGFLLMMGGKAEDPRGFNPDIFNFRRITLAPAVVLLGFLFEIFAIMYRPRRKE